MDVLSSFSDDDIQRMERNAYREAARCWQEYRAADAERATSDDARWLAQTLHDAAWSAENAWRALHDERVTRNLAIAS